VVAALASRQSLGLRTTCLFRQEDAVTGITGITERTKRTEAFWATERQLSAIDAEVTSLALGRVAEISLKEGLILKSNEAVDQWSVSFVICPDGLGALRYRSGGWETVVEAVEHGRERRAALDRLLEVWPFDD